MQSRAAFYILLGALAALSIAMLAPVFVPVTLAVIAGYLLTPIYDRAARWVPSRDLRAWLMVLLVLAVLAVPILIIVTQLTEQLPQALKSGSVEHTVTRVNDWIDSTLGRHVPIADNLSGYITRVREYAVQRAPRVLGAVGHTALALFIMLYTMFYVLRDGRHAWQSAVEMLPLEDAVKPLIITNIQQTVSGVLYGQLVTALVQGGLAGIGYWIFHVPNVALWTALTTISAMIPFVGTVIFWLPLAISRLAVGDKFGGFGLLIYCGVIVINIDNIIKPRLIAGRSALHPVAALLGVFGGIELFGVVGFIIGPVLLGLVVAMLGFHRSVAARKAVLAPGEGERKL